MEDGKHIVDFQLSEEQIALRDKARKFAIEEILPVSSKYDKSGEFPRPIFEKAHKAGLMNLGIPKQYGGSGYSSLESILIVEEIAAADPGDRFAEFFGYFWEFALSG